MFRKNTRHLQPVLISNVQDLPEKRRKRLEDSWAGVFYRETFSRLDERPFGVLYADCPSRPNVPVNVLVALPVMLPVTDPAPVPLPKLTTKLFDKPLAPVPFVAVPVLPTVVSAVLVVVISPSIAPIEPVMFRPVPMFHVLVLASIPKPCVTAVLALLPGAAVTSVPFAIAVKVALPVTLPTVPVEPVLVPLPTLRFKLSMPFPVTVAVGV